MQWSADHPKRIQVMDLAEKIRVIESEAADLRTLINKPEVLDFMRAVQLEAAHQRKRWSAEHDAGKADSDWFWLIGYLAGKALNTSNESGYLPVLGNLRFEKQLHRIVATAAACANWHLHKLGKTDMRPGIEPPKDET